MYIFGAILAIVFCSFILIMTGAILFLQKKSHFKIKNLVSFGFGILPILIGTVWIPQSFKDSPTYLQTISFMSLGFLFNALCERYLLSKFNFLRFLIKNEQTHDCKLHSTVFSHYHFLPKSTACSAVACFVLCSFFDGMRFISPISQSFSYAQGKDFLWVSLSLVFHLLPECLTLLSIALSGPFYFKNVLSIILVFYLSFIGGALMFLNASAWVFEEPSSYFAFATGLFLYICIVHLLPTVIKGGTKKYFALGLGFGLFFLQILPYMLGGEESGFPHHSH